MNLNFALAVDIKSGVYEMHASRLGNGGLKVDRNDPVRRPFPQRNFQLSITVISIYKMELEGENGMHIFCRLSSSSRIFRIRASPTRRRLV